MRESSSCSSFLHAGEEMHPLWQEIQWFVDGVRVEPLEDMVTGRAGELPEVAHAPLPRRSRWWKLPPEARISLRPKESYSSLNAFLNAPYQWVLKYKARLNPSNLLAVTDENRLYGNLAHTLIDRLFRADGAQALRGEGLKAWFSREFAAVVAEEGAVLLCPVGARIASGCASRWSARSGRSSGSSRRRGSTLWSRSAISPASSRAAPLKGRRTCRAKQIGPAGDHRHEMVRGQLLPGSARGESAPAAGRLRGDASPGNGRLAAGFYFILKESRLLAPDKAFFPEARPVQSGETGSTSLLWDQFIAAWKWRRAQIDAGMIEVAAEDIEPTPESVGPPDALLPEDLPEAYNDYRWLAGWEG